MQTDFYSLPELLEKRESAGKRYLEFLRIPSMSAGIYVLAAGASDPQRPHKQDELYYVVQGRARMRTGSEDRDVNPGTVIFVAKEVEHRFYDIHGELVVLVFFAPAESD